jgi:hypothetical protein
MDGLLTFVLLYCNIVVFAFVMVVEFGTNVASLFGAMPPLLFVPPSKEVESRSIKEGEEELPHCGCGGFVRVSVPDDAKPLFGFEGVVVVVVLTAALEGSPR